MIDLWLLPLPPSPVTALSADRVRLRPFEKADVPAIVEQGSDRAVAHWMISFPVPWPRWLARQRVRESRRDLASGRGYHFAITADDQPGKPMVGACSAIFVGDASRPPELAYWVAPPWQRQGYGRTALRLLLSHMFDADPALIAVEAAVIEGNDASADLLQGLHFGVQGEEFVSAPLSWEEPPGTQVRLRRYRLWRDDWFRASQVHIPDQVRLSTGTA
ncbi:MAG: hypothetical protein CME02_06310 [Geminicoccus sp.]|nr:hypothetical protein [Geminicoccus sp.]